MEEKDLSDQPTFAIHRHAETLDSGWLTLPGPYLLYAREGAFRVEVGDRQGLLPPQRAAWVPASTPFRLWADHPVESASILFSARSGLVLPPECCLFSVSPLAREMIVYATRWGEDRDPGDESADRFFLTVAEVCLELARDPEHLWLPLVRSELLRKTFNHVLTHLADPLTPDAVAEAMHTTVRTLTRYFSHETAITLGQFVQRARMLKAMELLGQSDLTVLEIVYTVGLKSPGSFAVAFRELVQETPLQYRKRFLKSRAGNTSDKI